MSRLPQRPQRPRRLNAKTTMARSYTSARHRTRRLGLPTAIRTAALAAAIGPGAMASGCADEQDGFSSGLTGTLEIEIRDSATIEIARGRSSAESTVRLTLSEGYGLAPEDSRLEAPGRIEAFPEAHATLYTARFSAPAQTDGPCGEQPVSLALSLHRQADSAMVLGGLSAYCGEQIWHGRPKRILRLSGELR